MASGVKRKREQSLAANISNNRAPLYTPLPTEQPYIRLVQIKARGSKAKLECRLSVHELAKAPAYAAISYVCGTGKINKSIIVNGIAFKIGPTSRFALWQCRTLGLAEYYWIDVLCINQTDLEEKGRQVRLMGRIFKCAEQVLGSLGQHDDHSRAIVAKLRSISGQYDKEFLQAWMSTHSREELLQLLSDADKFAERAYWHRLWIVQEIVLSKSIVLICGLDTVYLEPLLALFDLRFWVLVSDRFENTGDSQAKSRVEDSKCKYLNIRDALEDKIDRLRWAEFWTLDHLVIRYAGFQCAEPLDRVYAILHLINNGSDHKDLIAPDYNLSPIELAVQCLGIIASDRGYNIETLFGFAKKFCEALKINMQQRDMRDLVQPRQQCFLDLCTRDKAALLPILSEEERWMISAANRRGLRSDPNIILEYKPNRMILIERSDDGELTSNFDFDSWVAGDRESLCS